MQEAIGVKLRRVRRLGAAAVSRGVGHQAALLEAFLLLRHRLAANQWELGCVPSLGYYRSLSHEGFGRPMSSHIGVCRAWGAAHRVIPPTQHIDCNRGAVENRFARTPRATDNLSLGTEQ